MNQLQQRWAGRNTDELNIEENIPSGRWFGFSSISPSSFQQFRAIESLGCFKIQEAIPSPDIKYQLLQVRAHRDNSKRDYNSHCDDCLILDH